MRNALSALIFAPTLNRTAAVSEGEILEPGNFDTHMRFELLELEDHAAAITKRVCLAAGPNRGLSLLGDNNFVPSVRSHQCSPDR